MKKFRDLMEATDTIVFTFGRFNPPTTGHEKLIQKVVSVAGTNDYRIYPSHSQNAKKDPLPQALKTAYMRKMFKKYARNIVVTKSKSAIEIAVELYDQGYKNLIMIAGSDRVKVFDTMLNQYNGVEGKRHGYYKYDSIEIISAGERDPDSEGVEGMSASKMRAAAVDGNYDDFTKGLPSGFSDSKKLYRDVRKYMGIREERDMGDDYDSLRDAYLTGKIWNVGESVEVKGLTGEIVRKGTNYLSFVTEDGMVHKAWLHEIELDEKWTSSPSKISEKDFDALKKGDTVTIEYKSAMSSGTGTFKVTAKNVVGKAKVEKVTLRSTKNPRAIKHFLYKRGDRVSFAQGDMGAAVVSYKKEDFEINERNYRKEYDNYQGQPEQIARRSSRNKARRVMGDKTKIGMDVGHKDNNPLNNDPKNLRNEDPSKNRREPRLREKPELDELWYKDVMAKLRQIDHPRDYAKMVKNYADGMKDPEHRKHPSAWAADVAKEYRSVTARDLIKYINKLADDGKLPKEIKAEFTREAWSFKDFVNQIQDVNEKELTDTELKRREEIAKDLSDEDFKKRYGSRWKEVKMGTATKMAKKESLKT